MDRSPIGVDASFSLGLQMSNTDRSLRIAVSTPTFLPVVGGAEVGIHEIYSRIAARHDVTVITRPHPAAVLARYAAVDFERRRYRVRHTLPELERLPESISHYPRLLGVSYALELLRLHREKPLDVVNFHFIRPHLISALFAKHYLGVGTVLSLVGRDDVVGLLGRERRRYAAATLLSVDAVTPNSGFYLGGRPLKATVEVIPYGVDTRLFAPVARRSELRRELGISENAFVLLAVQRLAEVKRVDVLLDGIARLANGDGADGVTLVIVGQGPELRPLIEHARVLGIASQVKFVGYVPDADLPKYFAASDVFVSHSLFETFGVVFAQAMAAGLPVVAARTSCIPEVVTAANGILFTPFDTAGFASAVATLKSDESLRATFAQQNRARASAEFDWDNIAARYTTVLRRAVRSEL